MKHKASRDLYAYWNTLRGSRPAPERNEIDPGAIRGALGDTLMLARDPGEDAVFRLAGTRVCALFGRELKNTAFQPLWDTASRRHLEDLLDHAANDGDGFIAGVTAELADGTTVALELLLLPLSQRSGSDSRLIGVLAPALTPSWLGIHPVQSLKLNAWRYVGPQIDEALVSKFMDLPPEPVVRQPMGFIVHNSSV